MAKYLVMKAKDWRRHWREVERLQEMVSLVEAPALERQADRIADTRPRSWPKPEVSLESAETVDVAIVGEDGEVTHGEVEIGKLLEYLAANKPEPEPAPVSAAPPPEPATRIADISGPVTGQLTAAFDAVGPFFDGVRDLAVGALGDRLDREQEGAVPQADHSPLACEFCGKDDWTSPRSRTMHINRHQEDAVACPNCDRTVIRWRLGTHLAECDGRSSTGGCVHRWQLDPPKGQFVHQQCSLCGQEKDVPSDPSGSLSEGRRGRGGAA